MIYIRTYTFNHFYKQYLVLLTMVPRNSCNYLIVVIRVAQYAH